MKKLISVFLCAIMLFSTLGTNAFALTDHIIETPVEYGADYVIGDANDDSVVNAQDIFALRLYHAKLSDDINASGADANCDGKVSAKDMLMIKKLILTLVSADELYDTDGAVDRFLIGSNDISDFCIVYAPDAKYVENMYYSADVLKDYVKEATGVELAVSTEATAAHKIEFVDVTEIEGLEEKLEIENYKYEVRNGDLYIYGTRRGNMYAVYEILEDYLGYRFYSNDFTYQYNTRYVNLEEGISVYREPAMDFRFASQSFGSSGAISHYFPRRLNGSQLYRYEDEAHGTLTGPHYINAHSFGFYWEMATAQVDVDYENQGSYAYMEKYNAGGEYKDELTWNPCFTDDEHYETLFRGLLETMRYIQGRHTFREETSAMSFSICDNTNYCSCRSCRRMTKNSGMGYIGLKIRMANRAARDITAYYEGRPASTYADGTSGTGAYGEAIYDEYPDMKIYFITYDYTMPAENLLTDESLAEFVPEENLIMVFSRQQCSNHVLGSGECGEEYGFGNAFEAESLKAWGDVFKACGAQLWYWYYPVDYTNYIVDMPNVLNIYHDMVYMVEDCGINGIYYEGSNSDKYCFGNLKAHLASKVMWSFEYDENGELTYMSYDEYIEALKEYLYIFYGDGYEYVYEYLMMLNESSDQLGACYSYYFIGNTYESNVLPGDMYSQPYIAENYEYMRELLAKALDMAEDGRQSANIQNLMMSCEYLGLSACYNDYYASGEKTDIYIERYDWLYNYIIDGDIIITSSHYNEDPAYDLTVSPMRGWSFMNCGKCANDETIDALWP